MIKIWTDGSCFGNPGPGGWAFVVPGVYHGRGGEPHTTANRMELTAIVRALEWMVANGADGVVYSDCQWAIQGIYSKAVGVGNKDLLQDARNLLADMDGMSEILWVRRHAGVPQNERADALARLAAEEAKRDADKY